MNFPTHDWQFWTVTGVFVIALLWLTRGLIPWPGKKRRRGSRKATLTVAGKPLGELPRMKE